MNSSMMAATLFVILSAGSALAQNAVSRTVAVDSSFNDAGVSWTGATAGGYEARIALKNNGGRFEFCGVGVVTNIQLGSTVNTMLRDCTLNINGKTVLKNCRYFAKARSARALTKTKANCALTDMEVQEIEFIDFQYGSGTFRN